jgi:leader peptidase (prepilin peptidase)/N-methyltransferase
MPAAPSPSGAGEDVHDAALAILTAAAGAAVAPALDLAVARLPRHAGAAAGGPAGCTDECRPPLPHRRLLLTLSVAVVFGLIGASAGPTWDLWPALILAGCLLPLALCDLEHLLLPKRLVYPGTCAAAATILVATLATGAEHRVLVAAACSAGVIGVLGILWLVNPSGLGFGDVRLGGLIGLVLGWFGAGPVVAGLLIASLGAGLVGTGLLLTRRTRWGHARPLPFGVFLAAGSLTALLIALR